MRLSQIASHRVSHRKKASVNPALGVVCKYRYFLRRYYFVRVCVWGGGGGFGAVRCFWRKYRCSHTLFLGMHLVLACCNSCTMLHAGT